MFTGAKMDIVASILNNIDQSLLITDRDGGLLFFNREAIHTIGMVNKKPLRIGESIVTYASRERKKIVLETLQELSQRKQSVKTWAEYTQLNGLTMHLELNYVPIVDDQENILFISVLVKDITSSKVFEKKIRAQAANVESLIQKANAVIISTDSRGYITNWNEHCTRITGFEKNEVYTRKFVDVVLHESVREPFNELFSQMLSGEALLKYETKIQTKEGKALTCLLSATPQLTTTGTAIGVIFVGQDITELSEYRRTLEDKIEERTTELRRALQKEKELVEMKTRFVAVASHEFRTPLSSIQFAANFLKQYDNRISQPERYQKLDSIVAHVGHMTSLLDDVLTYGKNEAGRIDLILSVVNLRSFVRRVAEEAAVAERNSHRVVVTYQNAPDEIETDEKLLRSILANLLTNAIKFSPGKDMVHLTVSSIGKCLQIVVCDQGLGIPADELEKVFEPFLRGKGAATIAGTGLGLSITQKAVELLGGSIEIESQILNGTAFTVSIPLKLQRDE